MNPSALTIHVGPDSTPMNYLKSEYRRDIDGLRAIAISLVVIYHAMPYLLKGGFAGVDVFFVISGFLISSIIFKGLDSNRFNLLEFYNRRILRIFPALIVVLMTCYAVGWFSFMAVELKMLGKHTVGGIGFIQNIVLYKEAGYFDTSSELKPLLHLWSLGVEEQFYILFPLVAWIIWWWRTLALPLIAGLAILSFVTGFLKLNEDPSAAFYIPLYRFWEILAGTLLAYFTVIVEPKGNRYTRSAAQNNALSCFGFLLLVTSAFLIDKSKAFPGFWAILPVTGSVLLILAGQEAWLNRTVLSSRLMVWIGLISYPLYLWHWPVITFFKIIGAGDLGIARVLVALLISVALAYLTYKFVELPFRKMKPFVPKLVLLISFGIVIAFIGLATFLHGGYPGRAGLDASVKDREIYAQYFENSLPEMRYATEHRILEAYRAECDFYDIERYRAGQTTLEPRPRIDPECYTAKTDMKVMIWGDSHAQQFSYGLRKTLPEEVSILQVATSGCEANLPGSVTADKKYCERTNKVAFDVIRQEKPDVLIIAQLQLHDVSNNLSDLSARAKAMGVKNVIVVGPVPRYDPLLYQIVARKYWEYTPRRLSENLIRAPFDTDKVLKAKYSNANERFDYLSAIDVFCNVDGCLSYLGDDRKTGLVTFDYGHLTLPASVFFARQALAPLILRNLGAQHAYSALDK